VSKKAGIIGNYGVSTPQKGGNYNRIISLFKGGKSKIARLRVVKISSVQIVSMSTVVGVDSHI